MMHDSFRENIKNIIYRNYEDAFPSASLISQDNSENDFQFDLNEENVNSISNLYDNEAFRNLYLKEKTSADKTLFKIKLKEEAPILNSFDDIKQKIFKNALYEKKFVFDANNLFIRDKNLEELYLNKKRFRDYTDDDFIKGFWENEINQNFQQGDKKKRGRIPKVEGKEEHNRMTPDNIIKKIKAEFFKYLTLFLNNVINDKNTDNKIYKIDYRFINQLNKEIDLRYLNMPLKNLFSLLDVSPKYKYINPKSNKIYIKELLNGQIDEAIKFAFNITFRDWIDIFSFKKDVKDLLNKYNIKDDNNTIYQKIKESLVAVDHLLNNLSEKERDNKKYFSNFTFYLYNYELWFFKKKGRNSKSKSK